MVFFLIAQLQSLKILQRIQRHVIGLGSGVDIQRSFALIFDRFLLFFAMMRNGKMMGVVTNF